MDIQISGLGLPPSPIPPRSGGIGKVCMECGKIDLNAPTEERKDVNGSTRDIYKDEFSEKKGHWHSVKIGYLCYECNSKIQWIA